MAFWSDHHEDILFLILRKITNFSDFIRFRCVCSSWRAAAKQQQSLIEGFPGFIAGKHKNLSFIPISGMNCHSDILPSLPSLSLPEKSCCVGSYRGWLVIEDTMSNLTVINPVSMVQFSLPGPNTLNISMGKSSIRRVIFSSCPSTPNVFIFLFHGPQAALAYCRRGDRTWIDISSVFPSVEVDHYIDAIYYEGKLHALHESGKLLVCDLIASSPKIIASVHIPRLSRFPLHWSPFMFTVPHFLSVSFERCFLVESGGELLLVHCQKYFNPNTGNCKATTFEVYKFNTNIERWDPVTSLGDYALFLGRGQPFALSEFKVSGMKGNHIYYAEDFTDPYFIRQLRPCDGDNEIIVYSLENSNLEFLHNPFPSAKPNGMWFTPCLGGR